MLLLIVLSPPPPGAPLGGLGRGRGLDPLQEGGGLAPLQEHLPGVVRHGALGRPIQRRRYGRVRLRHPALRLRDARLGGRMEEEGGDGGGGGERETLG